MSWEVVNSTVEEWAANYDGPPFHALFCDPPYGLRFMGAAWDHGVPAAATWAALARHLLPGAHLLAFGGTRTFHRLVCSIEDAGFEVRDTLVWAYGCLSDDTEILTDKGWRKYGTDLLGSMVACCNVGTGLLEWGTVEQTFDYAYRDTAYRLRGDRSDQLVSRNHRCLVERGGRTVFVRAEALEGQETVPVLESLPSLRGAVRLRDKGARRQGQGVQSRVCSGDDPTAPPLDPQDHVRTQGTGHSLRGLRQRGVATQCVAQGCSSAGVLQAVQRPAQRSRMGQARAQGKSRLDGPVLCQLPREDVRTEQPRVEGRRDVQTDPRKPQGSALCPLPGRVPADGPQARVCHGASAGGGPGSRPLSGAVGVRPPLQPRPLRQPTGELGAVPDQPSTQVLRGAWRAATDLVRVEPVFYAGRVWCVKVPTGAFVARRNGKVFVTGNSGFPKSRDIGKAIDAEAGAEREVVGKHHGSDSIYNGPPDSSGSHIWTGKLTSSVAATPEVAAWEGYGSALKPAVEPICLARLPLDGTLAQNALRHGTGALNIDGGRVGTDGGGTHCTNRNEHGCCLGHNNAGRSTSGETFHGPETSGGRWPANLLHDGSPEVVARFPETGPGNGAERRNSAINSQAAKGAETAHSTWEHEDSAGSAARFFACCGPDAPDDPARLVYVPKAGRRERDAGLEGLDSSKPVCYNEASEETGEWDSGESGQSTPVDVVVSRAGATTDSTCGTQRPNHPGSSLPMSSCGKKPSEPCLPGCSSTTETGTSRTTDSPIYNSLTPPLTSDSTGDASCETGSGGSPASYAESSSRSPQNTGISAGRDGPNTAGAGNATSAESLKTSGSGRPSGARHKEARVSERYRNAHPT